MPNKLKPLLLLLLSIIIISEPTHAAPRGAVTLTASNLFQSGNIRCGRINGTWIPGRMIRGGFFYPKKSERANLLKQARSASGLTKTKLLRKAEKIRQKLSLEAPVCLSYIAMPTPTATSPGFNATPTPTPTATPSLTPTATPTATPIISLSSINSNLYYTEHALFIIPEVGQVTFEGAGSWDSVYSTANINSYLSTLRTHFPGDYFMAVVTASNLQPDRAPNVLNGRLIAYGIGQNSFTDPTLTNICRYHSVGPVNNAIYGVLDHEVGHNWAVFLGNEVGEGHWRTNSTATGQMASNLSDDGFVTVKRITGNPVSGFTWTAIDNSTKNETETFSDQDLYILGLNSTFPPLYVLASPVYNSNGTISHSGVSTYDHAWVEATHGVRNPNYRNSGKNFKYGFIYIARDYAEIETSYRQIERSIKQYTYADTIDTNNFRFQVPFLTATKHRASISARLANLDGNTPPNISLTGGTYYSTSSSTLAVPFTTSDAESAVTVSCVPASVNCSVSGPNIQLSGLSSGAHFFTLRAQDAGGKLTFAHFVVDVV